MNKAFQLLMYVILVSFNISYASNSYDGIYWIDNQSDNAIEFIAEESVLNLNIDIDNLNEGFHYVNIRMRESSSVIWGTPLRKTFYHTNRTSSIDKKSMEGIFWIDNNIDAASSFNATDGIIDLSTSLEGLEEGFHYVNIRVKETNSNIWGTPLRKSFYVRDTATANSDIEGSFWIDNNIDSASSFNTTDGIIDLSTSLEGLEEGFHYVNIRLKNSGTGIWGTPFRKAFYYSYDKKLLGYRHSLNGKTLGYVELEPNNDKEQLIALDLLNNSALDRSKRQYSFEDGNVVSTLDVDVKYELQFNSVNGWGIPKQWDIPIHESHTAQAKEVDIPSITTFKSPKAHEFETLRFTTNGGNLYFQSEQEATLDIYTDGKLKQTLSASELKSNKEVNLEKGTYYGILCLPAQTTATLDSIVLRIMDINDKVASPRISFEDGYVKMQASTQSSVIYYTTDGSDPIVGESILYSEPFKIEYNATIKAIATLPEYDVADSDITSFTIDSYNVDAPYIAYSNLQIVIMQSKEEGVTTRFTLDGTDPTEISEPYFAPFNLTADATVKARSFKQDWNPSDVVEFNYVHATYVTSSPTISVEGPTVTITATDEGSTVWYAVNDADLAKMKEYTAPFTIDRACVIHAQARKEGLFPSEIVSHEVKSYKLTYMVDDAVYKELDLLSGISITPEPEPAKDGYTFSGWNDVPETMPTHDVTVSGTFSVNSYKLTYMLDDELYAEHMVEFGAAITPEPEPAKEGYTFSGWDNVPETMPAHDVTVAGTFSVDSYTLTYMLDGEVYAEYKVEFGAAITPEADPEKEGHTFSGWDNVPETMPANDVTVSGNFSINSYTLTYLLDGEPYKEYTVEFGAAITPEPDPTKEGHIFSGWGDVPETMPAHDVTVRGSFMEKPYSAKPQISYDGRYVTIDCEDQEADILFTVDEADMTKAEAYEGKFDAFGLHTICAFTVRDGYNDSETSALEILAYSDDEHAEIAEEGHLAEAFSWMNPTTFAAINNYAFSGPLGGDDYAVVRSMKNMLNLDLTEVTSREIPNEALKGLDLLTLHFPKATEAYGDSIIDGNIGLCAISVNSPAEIPADAFGSYRNPNLLVYASEAYIDIVGHKTPGIDWIRNVIADGASPHIDVLTLTDESGWFSCPKEFTAGEARFIKSFSKRTVIGGARGWETISLPYGVDEIRKGDQGLIPFSAYEGSDEYKPFWLYAPTGGSWEKASSIDANLPYLISMPNCPEYDESFNIVGDVTFIGRNQTIGVTPDMEGIRFNADSQIWPNFSSIPNKNKDLLVVNDTEIDGYAPGGRFIKGEHDVRAFECYVTNASGRRSVPIFDSSDLEILMDFTLEIWSEKYDLFIRSPYTATFRIFDLNGQLVRIVKTEAGAAVRVADLTPGIYFVGDRKVLVK